MKTNIKSSTDSTAEPLRWISASECLPEPGIAVAVLTNGGKMHVLALSEANTRASRDDRGLWSIAWYVPLQNVAKRRSETYYRNQITHWLSLPPAPLKVSLPDVAQ